VLRHYLEIEFIVFSREAAIEISRGQSDRGLVAKPTVSHNTTSPERAAENLGMPIFCHPYGV
jgi:hypothetical protein